MLNQFKTALLVWLQTIWHSFLSFLCWALPNILEIITCTSVNTPRIRFLSLSLFPSCFLSILFPHMHKTDMQAFIVFACFHVQVYAVESACGVFVSRSERPAPVINGVPVWGTARRRTQSLGQTAAPPGLSFTWEKRKAGRRKEGGWRGNFFSLVVLYSLFPSFCPSILLFSSPSSLKLTTLTTHSRLSYLFLLSAGPCPGFSSPCLHVHMSSHTCIYAWCGKHF